MKNIIQNIFIDLKSYELIQDLITLDELIAFLLNNIDTFDIHPISIKGYLFEVEYHPQNDYLGFTYTLDGLHNIYYEKCRFRNSIYLYSARAFAEYEEGFSGITLLMFTRKKSLYVIPQGENDLSKMDCTTGKFTPIL